MFKHSSVKMVSIFIPLLLIVSCSKASDNPAAQSSTTASLQASAIMLDIYKSPSCGCCKKWIDHLDESGLQSTAHNQNDVSGIKNKMGIAPQYRSCHTAVSQDGYIFEGHVPAKFIKQFLAEKHQGVIGLSVPAMPIGTPGMEMGDKFMPYQVLILKKDGSSDVYAKINSYKEQF
jgi:hypothetical protein